MMRIAIIGKIRIWLPALVLAAFSLSFAGCEGDDGPPAPPVPPAEVASSRTLLVYLASQNSLGGDGFDLDNIEGMVEGATFRNIGNNKIIVYHDLRAGGTEVLEISAGDDGLGRKIVLDEFEDRNFDDPEVFQEAVDYMKAVAPAESYGLVMWSHASGWLPVSFAARAMSRAVLQDEGSGFMELQEFADAIPAGLFDFIIFDECYMSGVEVLWAVKDKTDYVVASAAEELGAGMPYVLILPHIFAKDIRLGAGGVGQTYYDYWNGQSGAVSSQMRSATIALFDCREVDDEFAGIIRSIIAENTDKLEALTPEGIQFYDRYDSFGYAGVRANFFFEMSDLVDALCDEGDPLRRAYDDKMNAIVRYKACTPFVIGEPKDPERFSGMTTYIPFRSEAKYAPVNASYAGNGWFREVYPENFGR